jgi:hypothetical protein
MMVVGIGSFLFHATLRRYAQCMDELPMLYASISLFYNTLDYAPRGFGLREDEQHHPITAARRNSAAAKPWFAQVRYRIGLKVLLLTAGVVLTMIYFYLPEYFAVFFLGYSSFLVSFCAIMGYHIFCGERNARRHEALRIGPHGYEAVSTSANGHSNGNGNGSSSFDEDRSSSFPSSSSSGANKPYTPVLGRLFYGAVLGYFGGFVFWMYENSFCATLPPWLQLHGQWLVQQQQHLQGNATR